jgi:hypothetical protein
LKEVKRFILNRNAAKTNADPAEKIRRDFRVRSRPSQAAGHAKKANSAAGGATTVAHERPATGSPANFIGNSVQPPPWDVLRKLSGRFYNINPVEM